MNKLILQNPSFWFTLIFFHFLTYILIMLHCHNTNSKANNYWPCNWQKSSAMWKILHLKPLKEEIVCVLQSGTIELYIDSNKKKLELKIKLLKIK